jgi:hypothetical protein
MNLAVVCHTQRYLVDRVEMKIFVFAFSQKFIFVFAKIALRKLKKKAENLAKIGKCIFGSTLVMDLCRVR